MSAPIRSFPLIFDPIGIPVDMLRVVGVACKPKDASDFALSAVLVERRPDGLIAVVSTDGRRMMMATWQSELADSPASVLIPASTAKQIISTADRPGGEDYTLVTLTLSQAYLPASMNGGQEKPAQCLATYEAHGGPATVEWTDDGGRFPAYRDVIPDYNANDVGTPAIGINPDLMAPMLKIISKIVCGSSGVGVYLPKTPTRPILLKCRDVVTTVEVVGVLMPMNMQEIADRAYAITELKTPASADGKPQAPAAESDPNAPMTTVDLSALKKPKKPAKRPGGVDAWKSVPIGEVGLSDFDLGILLDHGVTTIGILASTDLKKIKGIGVERQRRIGEAVKNWHCKNIHMSQPVMEEKEEEPKGEEKPEGQPAQAQTSDAPAGEAQPPGPSPQPADSAAAQEAMVVTTTGEVVPESAGTPAQFIALSLANVIPGAVLIHKPTGGLYLIHELSDCARCTIGDKPVNLAWPDIFSGRFALHTPAPTPPAEPPPADA